MTDRPTQALKEISLTGYKSIREVQALRLNGGLNVLIGANGSGKTNFIRFFELLGHMMDPSKGLQNYVSARGRADAFLFRGMKVTSQLTARLKFGMNEYRFSLRAADDRSLFFAQESAPYFKPSGEANTTSVSNDMGEGHPESRLRGSPPSNTVKAALETLQGWRVYHFHDTSSSAPVMGLCNVVDSDVLRGDAGNLAAFLWRIAREHPQQHTQFEETIRQVAPFFGGFLFKEVAPGQTQLLWRDRFCDLVYYPHQLSDGTLRFICLVALLLQPEPASTLIIDEPELGLHPFAIKLLASMLHEAAQRTQLIVSTQSSLLLDELSADQVIVANSRDGETTLERLDPERLQEWLKEYTLGQLWEKNQLGGLP